MLLITAIIDGVGADAEGLASTDILGVVGFSQGGDGVKPSQTHDRRNRSSAGGAIISFGVRRRRDGQGRRIDHQCGGRAPLIIRIIDRPALVG